MIFRSSACIDAEITADRIRCDISPPKLILGISVGESAICGCFCSSFELSRCLKSLDKVRRLLDRVLVGWVHLHAFVEYLPRLRHIRRAECLRYHQIAFRSRQTTLCVAWTSRLSLLLDHKHGLVDKRLSLVAAVQIEEYHRIDKSVTGTVDVRIANRP